MSEKSSHIQVTAAAGAPAQPGHSARRPYQAPQLVELGPLHELTRGDIGPDDDTGTTRPA